jgi:hypothetical protein
MIGILHFGDMGPTSAYLDGTMETHRSFTAPLYVVKQKSLSSLTTIDKLAFSRLRVNSSGKYVTKAQDSESYVLT